MSLLLSKEGSSYVEIIQFITGQEGSNVHDFWLFLGRFHPIALHLPIGLIIFLFCIEAYSYYRKQEYDNKIFYLLAFLIIASSSVAIILGSFLSLQNDYNSELIDRHALFAYIMLVSLIAAFIVKHKYIKKATNGLKKVYYGLIMLSLIFMSIAGHDGGSLTHGKNYLFKYAPNFIRNMAGYPNKKESTGRKRPPRVIKPNPPVNSPKIHVYNQMIQPFFNNYCIECHGEEKAKAKLRLDTLAFTKKAIEEGSEEDPFLLWGDAQNSDIHYSLVTDNEDEIMPPEKVLTQDEKDLIKWWINSNKKLDDEILQKDIPKQYHKFIQ